MDQGLDISHATPVLAVVTPCFNEQEVLPTTLERLLAILDQLTADQLISPSSYIACVDDGSRDDTWNIITRWSAETGGRVRGVKLSRNFGHQNALIAGLLTCECDAVVSLDADLQDPPEVIIEMVKRFREGHDIVYGARYDRSIDGPFAWFSAKIFYRFMHLLGVKLVLDHADFRLLSRRAVEALARHGESRLFLRGIIPYLGYPSSVVKYVRVQRHAGKSKYPLSKLIALAWSGISTCSAAPLTLLGWLGVAGFAAAIILALTGWGRESAQLIISGASLLAVGIMAQYVARIHDEVKGRPRYIIAETTREMVREKLTEP